MLNHEDLKWIATTSTELNSILQQIARYSDLARRHKGEYNYIDLLGERVELASKTAQALFDRVTSLILSKATATYSGKPAAAHTPFTVLPPHVHSVPAKPGVAKTAGVAQDAPSAAQAVIDAVAAGSKNSSAAATSANGIPSDIKVKNAKGARELILLIEDEAEVAEVAADLLADEGYKVIEAHDGFEALKIYERLAKKIRLVILDFFLPIMDGDAVFDELRALNPKVDVVLSSGFAEHHKISAMLAQGLRGFIPKPYSREKLLAQVRSTLDAAGQNGR
jgi:CheY-like chemotaxis protein